MFLTIGRLRQAQELVSLQTQFAASQRAEVQMLLIDDEDFAYLDFLTRHDFRIKAMQDIVDIHAVEAYPIILCDIVGVGVHFQSPFQGAHLISEIRKFYPWKMIIAYTGHTFDASFNEYFHLADHVVKKDMDGDSWIELLDNAISETTNPVLRWYRLRDHLVKKGVPLIHIARLEDNYTRSVLANSKEFPRSSLLRGLSEEQKTLLLKFAATAVATLLTK